MAIFRFGGRKEGVLEEGRKLVKAHTRHAVPD